MKVMDKKSNDNTNSKIKIQFDKNRISSEGGLSILLKYIKKIRFTELLGKFLTLCVGKSKNNVTGRLLSIIISIIGGHHTMYEIDRLKNDPQFKETDPGCFSCVSTTIARTIKKFGEKHIKELYDAFHAFTRKIFGVWKKITIDMDSTVTPVFGNQSGAKKGYNPHKKGLKSYHPLLAFCYETKNILHGILRPGDHHTSHGAGEFLNEVLSNLPRKIKKIFLRCDCGFYANDFIKQIEDSKRIILYVIKVNMKNKAQVLGLDRIADWVAISDGVSVGEVMYQAGNWDKPRRIIVLRKEILYTDKENLFEHIGYEYHCYVTNITWKPVKVIDFYNKRAGAENYIKDFKYGYGWGKMLTNNYWANKVIFLCTMLAYNLGHHYLSAVCQENNSTISSVRYKYIYQAATVSFSGRYHILHFQKDSPLKEIYNRLLAG